jgi:hypothetical protein
MTVAIVILEMIMFWNRCSSTVSEEGSDTMAQGNGGLHSM